jgi:hypothetical protein
MISDKVKIGWREYIIKQGEHRTADNGGDLYGQIKYDDNEIYLYDKQTEENKHVTLLHEIIHGIFYMSGHSEWRGNEDLIECVSEGLYQVIRDNPGIFRAGDTDEV